jgi:uncharacterized protein with HEPN domain
MRREALYLRDILLAADAIRRFLTGVQRDEFLSNPEKCSAVAHQLAIIGEAVANLGPEVRQEDPAVAWGDIAAFRNVIVHRYFGIDWSVVWDAAEHDVPELRRQVEDILTRRFPDIHFWNE